MPEIVIRRFEGPDEDRRFQFGTFELVTLGGVTVGRARYEPGWKWSEHVGPTAGTPSCEVEHVGMVLSGRAAIAMGSGESSVVGPGDIFYVPPGHDSWVVGDEPYVSLHLLGAESYASE
jgi:quercetin dioxygenase-like cupin family protein